MQLSTNIISREGGLSTMIKLNSKIDKQLQYIFNDAGGFICTQLLDRPNTVKHVKNMFEIGQEIELLEGNSQLDFIEELNEVQL